MDSYQTIFEAKKYDLLLSLTEKAEDGESLFYRASALLSLNRPFEAMEIFDKNRKALFEYNPLITLKHDFELRILLNQFDEAYSDLDEFRSFPYVSQIVEERLKVLPSYLRKKEREALANKNISVVDAKRILSSPKNDMEILMTLEAISKVAIDSFLPEIKSILVSNIHPSVKTYAFLLLINCKYDEEVTFVSRGQEYHLIPKDVEPPFVSLRFKTFKDNLSSIAKDPSVSGVAFSLFSDYTLAIFPSSPFEEQKEGLLLLSFYSLALDYLRNSSVSLKDNSYLLPLEEIEKKKEEISCVLASIPPLSE